MEVRLRDGGGATRGTLLFIDGLTGAAAVVLMPLEVGAD